MENVNEYIKNQNWCVLVRDIFNKAGRTITCLCFEKHFDITDYDPNLKYDKSHNFVYRTDDALETSMPSTKDQGSRFIADGLWEKFFWCDQ